MNKKILLVLLFISLGLITGCGNNKKETKKTEKKDLTFKDQVVDVFSFKDAKIVDEGETVKLSVTITNTSNERQELKEIKAHLKDSKGADIDTILIYSCEWIDENKIINAWAKYQKTSKDVKSIEYEIIK